MVTQLISQGLPTWEHSSSANNIAQQANIVDIESIRQEYERSWWSEGARRNGGCVINTLNG